MSDILLITPPDKIYNQNQTCLLVYPSNYVKQEIQNILANSSDSFNIYVYEINDHYEHNLDWLLSVCKFADLAIIDIDNCERVVRDLASYLVSLPRTYWLTQQDNQCYSLLSPNRIYGLDSIKDILGGSIEEE